MIDHIGFPVSDYVRAKACPKGLNPSEAIAELKLKLVERQV